MRVTQSKVDYSSTLLNHFVVVVVSYLEGIYILHGWAGVSQKTKQNNPSDLVLLSTKELLFMNSCCSQRAAVCWHSGELQFTKRCPLKRAAVCCCLQRTAIYEVVPNISSCLSYVTVHVIVVRQSVSQYRWKLRWQLSESDQLYCFFYYGLFE